MSRLYPISAVILFAFTALPAMAQGTQPSTKNLATPAQPAKESADDPIVVKVSGESITEKQVLSAIEQIARQQQLMPQQTQQNGADFFKNAVDNLISTALLRSEGKAKKVTVDAAQVDGTFRDLAGRFPSPEQFKTALEQQGLTEATFRKSIEESMLLQQVLDLALKDLPGPTEDEVRKFYEGNPQYFQEPEQVHTAHILLKVDNNATPEQKAAISKKLEALRSDIENKKITFAEAAAGNSEDETNAKNGGDLGFFGRGQMVKPFEDSAFAAKPGTVTPVVETQFGYHLINVLAFKPAGKKSLDESKQTIQSFLEQKSKQDGARKYIAGLRAKAQVETVMTEPEWNKRHQPK